MSVASPARTRTVSVASIDELDVAIQRLACHANAVGYRMLLLVREFDDRFGWSKWGFETCAEWLHWRIGISLSAAREKVRTAHALRDLPAISAAFEKGQLSYSKARALTRAANAVNEKRLLEFALATDAVRVEERCREIRNCRPESAQEARQAWRRRSLRAFRHPSRHTLTISVEVPLEDGEVVMRALEKAVQSGDVASGPELGEGGWHAQQADALVSMAKSYLAYGASGVDETGDEADGMGDGADEVDDGADKVGGDVAGTSEAGNRADASAGRKASKGSGHRASVSADHYQVVVHVDEAALRGGAGRSELPIETVRRLACDCSITVVTEDAEGQPLSVGRKQRIVPISLRRALWARDRGCTFPGCHNKLFADAHHLKHWANGGETNPDNTALLCTYHHHLVHDAGFRMRRLDDGSFEFRRPDGRVIPPGGYRVDDAAPDPAMLEDFEYPSAEAWLAALIARGDRRGWGSPAAGRSPSPSG